VAVGTCSITATQPGNATYTASPAVIQSFTVNPIAQAITFNALGNVSFTLETAVTGVIWANK